MYRYTTHAQNAAGRNLPNARERRLVKVVRGGGSERRETWKNNAGNILQKCTAGLVVKRDMRVVKISVGARPGQRRSAHSVLEEERNAKVCGK